MKVSVIGVPVSLAGLSGSSPASKKRSENEPAIIAQSWPTRWRTMSTRAMLRSAPLESTEKSRRTPLAPAEPSLSHHLGAVPEQHIEVLQLDAEAKELAEAYITEGVIMERMRADAQHIAMAAVARVDVVVSWNFKHIVNLYRIHGYNSVNLRRGYPTLEIRAPREILPDE